MKIMLLICVFLSCNILVYSQQDDKTFVKEWVKSHPEVKIVSQFMYNRYNEGEKAEFNALDKKIVYQEYLTKADIELYIKSHETAPKESSTETIKH